MGYEWGWEEDALFAVDAVKFQVGESLALAMRMAAISFSTFPALCLRQQLKRKLSRNAEKAKRWMNAARVEQ